MSAVVVRAGDQFGGDHSGGDESVYIQVAQDLQDHGYSVICNGLRPMLAEALWRQLQRLDEEHFCEAGIGRSVDHTLNQFVRRDRIRWIEGRNTAEQNWLSWSAGLQRVLNRRLFLGLFSFESHYAHYGPGDFYKKHLDAFRGNSLAPSSQRLVSLVVYLNPGWLATDGGELVIYDTSGEQPVATVAPEFGTVVAFLSEEVPHEVLAARRDRYSIAGWFRVNGSLGDRIDPPR